MRPPKKKRKFDGKNFELTRQMKTKLTKEQMQRARALGKQIRTVKGQMWKLNKKRELKPVGKGYRLYVRKKK